MIQKTPFAVFAATAVASALFASFVIPSAIAAPPPGPRAAAANRYLTTAAARLLADRAISPAQLKDYLTFIASDELQGRDTPSNGLNTAAKFLATNLSRWGFKPAGDGGTFFQKIPLSRSRIDTEKTQVILNGSPLVYLNDFVLLSGRGRGASPANSDIGDAPLVYVGQGWVLPKKSIDPYAGIDVKGKVIVAVQPSAQRSPRGPDFAGAVRPEQYGASHGAAGVVYISDNTENFAAFRAGLTRFSGGFSPASPQQAPPPGPQITPLPVVYLSPSASRQLFEGESRDSAAAVQESAGETPVKAFDLASTKKLSLTVRYATDTETTQNVVAVWEGSDPKLKSEYVAFGAHYDHVGMSAAPDASGDTIFNGADDDGSGTVALLAIADALHQSAVRPRRSTLFVWHCGEEKGLWGSAHFTDHPTVPLNKIAAQLNIDMIGRSKLPNDTKPANASLSGQREIYVIGSRLMSTQLGNLSERVNKGYQNLKFNYAYDDPNDPNRFFYRSDHVNYAVKGIPIIFWFDGVHEDYHRRSDEVAKIDFAKMSLVTRTVFVTAIEIANLPEKLVVDKKLALPGRE